MGDNFVDNTIDSCDEQWDTEYRKIDDSKGSMKVRQTEVREDDCEWTMLENVLLTILCSSIAVILISVWYCILVLGWQA